LETTFWDLHRDCDDKLEEPQCETSHDEQSFHCRYLVAVNYLAVNREHRISAHSSISRSKMRMCPDDLMVKGRFWAKMITKYEAGVLLLHEHAVDRRPGRVTTGRNLNT
jgi:hypothetical protein